MRLEVTRLEGLRNDLLLRLERSEIETALLSIANRGRLMALPGIPRHRAPTEAEARDLEAAKMPIEDHVRQLGLTDTLGMACRRAVAISNRNLGTNHGHLAWQRSQTPRLFCIREDPCDYPAYSCLTVWRTGELSIEDLRLDPTTQRVTDAADGHDLSGDVEWATFGQRVLRAGRVVRVDDILEQFYDVRHVLAFDPHRADRVLMLRGVYRDYPAQFGANLRHAWRDQRAPRARYFHNAVGRSEEALFIVQREGTIEEIGAALKQAGADDGIILDNGGSVACWVWWANRYAGGLISPTVDYRPPGTSAIAFVLKGPVTIDLPGGSVSPSVY